MPSKITGPSRNTTSNVSTDTAPVATPTSKTDPTTPAAVTARVADAVTTPVTAPTLATQAALAAQTQAAALAAAALQQKSDPISASTTVTAGPVTASGSVTADASLTAMQISSATATAALKALLGGTTLTTQGTLVVANNKLTSAQLTAAVQTLFGPNAQLGSDGSFSIDNSGVSAQLKTEFKAVYGALSLDTSGSLSVKNGALSGSLQAQVQDVLGANTIITNNQVQFDGTGFASASLNDQLVSKLGPDASLTTQVQASVDRDGVASATATAAFKALLGNTVIDTTGSGLTVTNNTLSAAQFEAAVSTVFGPNATLSNAGSFKWDPKGGVSADLVSAFKLATQSLTLSATGTLAVTGGKVSGQLQQSLNAVLGKATLVANNQVVFKDNAFVSAGLNDQLVAKFGPQSSLDTTFQASIDASGIASATATAAFKALLGNTTIDTTGTSLSIANNKLSAAQFQAAVQTVFGPNATLSSDGTFKWDPKSGVSADLVSSFKVATKALKLETDGTLSVVGGKVSGSLQENLNAVLGKATVVANNQIAFKDNTFVSAALNDSLITQFGPAGSLDTTFQASIDSSGVASATATAAFKALLGSTSIDTTGTSLTITNNKLSAAQFQAAVSTVFGPNATLASNGTFAWDPKSGVSGDLVSAFKLATKSLTLTANGTLSVTGGKVSGQLQQSLNAVLGNATVVAKNQVAFKDNAFVSAALNDSLVAKFGSAGSLDTTFQASIDASGVASASATAAFKALLGNTSIDTSGTSLTIANNKLSAAQFQAAVQTVFGPNATLSSDGTFKWDPQSGVSGDLVSSFKVATQNLKLNADGTLSVAGGKVSGSLQENLNAVLGKATVVANNNVVLKDNAFVSAALNDSLVAQFGSAVSLNTTFQASIDSSGIASANATAAFKALLGNTTIDTSGTSLTITNNKLSAAQFQAAVNTVFGPNATLASNGTFKWDPQSGVSADLVSSFKLASQGLKLNVDGTLAVVGGKVSGSLQQSLDAVLGKATVVANNQVVFKDNAFVSATLDNQLVAKFGPSSSLASTFQASIDSSGVASANATAAFKALLGNTSIDTSGTGLTIKNNALTSAQFQAAVTTVFGPKATLASDGSFKWDATTGVSGDLVSSFKLATRALTLNVNGTLSVAGGRVSGSLQENLNDVLGNATVVANNQVVFKDNGFQSATLNDEVINKFGNSASLDTVFKASVNQDGLTSATATAAFKALVGNTLIDTTGTGLTIKNNQLTDAQFKAAIQTTFGPNAKLSADGSFAWNNTTGVSAETVAAFKGTYAGVSIDANGALNIVGGKVSGTLAANLSTTLGSNTIVSNNQVVFKDNGFQSATLDNELVSKFGSEASLATTFKASIDQSGIATATATAAYKALIGNTTIDTTGSSLTIKNNKLTDAQFAAAIATTFGPNAKLTGAGTFTWDAASGVSADVAAAFTATVKNVTLDTSGNLTLSGGKLDGRLAENITTTLGSNTFVANNQVVFKDSKFYSATLEDSLTKQFGAGGSLTANVAATVKQNGLIDGTISLAAFTRLKELSSGGAINLQTDGTITIKDNRIDRAEVSALLTLVAGKDVNVSSSGKLIYADGKIDPQFGANLQAAWGATSVAANGTLTFVGGSPQVTGQVSALFGGANLKGGASIAVTGADSAQLNLQLNELGSNTSISQTGSLIIDKGRITGGGLTTNLVTQGKTPADVSLSGLISLSDDQAAANFKSQVNLGVFSAGLGISASSTVSVYTATKNDPDRLAVQNSGGVWAQRDATFDLSANAGAGITVLVGAVPITLGFTANAEKQREVHTLSIHPSQEDALAQSPVTVIHPPTTVDQILSMRPFEQYSDSGTQSIGMGGNASIGIGAGPAAVKAGGSVYFQITGNLSRDIERLENNQVRVRIKRGSGTTDVKALTASIGLDAGKIATNNALVQKAAPLVQQLAQAGVSAKWQTVNQDEPVFDVTIDLNTPFGKSAMEHLLTGELTEAQYYAGYRDSGVQLNSEVDCDVKATTRTLDLNLGILDAQSLSRWLDAKQTSVSPADFSFVEAVDDVASKKALFPWNPDSRSDVRFVHETRVANTKTLPDIDKLKKAASLSTMVAHIADDDDKVPDATLADAAALFGLRFRLSVPKTGQAGAQSATSTPRSP